MARDPYWIFVYWELTDDAIARARGEIQAPDADCYLRVYDTTYRLFDGTNASWYMDVSIHRPANNHYVHVGRPGSTVHVDIGVKSHEGHFARIARSGPVDVPRDSIATDSRVEWMTVSPEAMPWPAYEHRVSPRSGVALDTAWTPEGSELELVARQLVGEGWERTEWGETEMGGRVVRWMRWTGPVQRHEWRTADVAAVRVEIVFEGERRVIHATDGVRVVFGPWRVIIDQIGPGGARRVIDRWTVHHSWLAEGGMARVETLPLIERIVRGYRTAQSAGSEAWLLTESLASEALQVGASEWRWLGASELWLQGASETLFVGASETRYLGASELLFLGASELGRRRASESLALGASEWLQPGASDWPLPPSSETRP
jgi:hypothetical protein